MHSASRDKKVASEKLQTEKTKLGLVAIARQQSDLPVFAALFAEIISLWETLTKEKSPLGFAVNFCGAKVTLREIFCLMPEEYQALLPTDDWQGGVEESSMSWLNEGTMNALVQSHFIYAPRIPQGDGTWALRDNKFTHFGKGLASNVRESLDDISILESSRSWLENQVDLMDSGAKREDWNPEEVYTFPITTKKIVHFFNYTEVHWTLIESTTDENKWHHKFYDSFSPAGGNQAKGPTWNAVVTQMPLLEKLICDSSGAPRPSQFPGISIASCAQQANLYDCGVITVYNAIEILNGRIPKLEVDTRKLRLEYVTLILEILKRICCFGPLYSAEWYEDSL